MAVLETGEADSRRVVVAPKDRPDQCFSSACVSLAEPLCGSSTPYAPEPLLQSSSTARGAGPVQTAALATCDDGGCFSLQEAFSASSTASTLRTSSSRSLSSCFGPTRCSSQCGASRRSVLRGQHLRGHCFQVPSRGGCGLRLTNHGHEGRPRFWLWITLMLCSLSFWMVSLAVAPDFATHQNAVPFSIERDCRTSDDSARRSGFPSLSEKERRVSAFRHFSGHVFGHQGLWQVPSFPGEHCRISDDSAPWHGFLRFSEKERRVSAFRHFSGQVFGHQALWQVPFFPGEHCWISDDSAPWHGFPRFSEKERRVSASRHFSGQVFGHQALWQVPSFPGEHCWISDDPAPWHGFLLFSEKERRVSAFRHFSGHVFGHRVLWQVSHLGLRVGEARHPGHRRRPAKGHGLAMSVANVRLRSLNIGGARNYAKKNLGWPRDDPPDVCAYQETWADAKDILDTTRLLEQRQHRSFWSAAGPAKGQGSGTVVTALRPLVAKPFFDMTFDTELAALWDASRVSGSWIETRTVGGGFAVLSFYGISGSNNDTKKRLASERYMLALVELLGAFRHRPVFLCADANLSLDKSDVMTALLHTGWVDLAEGLGNTFRVDPTSEVTNSKIDFVFANPAAQQLVADVKLTWLDRLQHAAIDISLHLSLTTGPVDCLRMPRRLPLLGKLPAVDAEKFEAWSRAVWKRDFADAQSAALARGDAERAWSLCEEFDASCLELRLELSGTPDELACRGRGAVPQKRTVLPSSRRAVDSDYLWLRFQKWLYTILEIAEEGTLASELRRDTLWRVGSNLFRGFLGRLFELPDIDPGDRGWWHGLRLRLEAAFRQRAEDAACRAHEAKTKWIKLMHKTAEACRYLKGQAHKRTSHLVDQETGEIVVAVNRMHDMLLKAWQPLFQLYTTSPEPSWKAFQQEYEQELRDWHSECPQLLPAGALEQAVRSRDSRKVGGTDGWATHEGHLLPSVSFDARQHCLEAVMDGAAWPTPLLFGTVPLVPKSESGLPADQRPLTCLSLWNVGWDKATYTLTKEWLESLMPCAMRGARPEAMTMDIVWVVTLLIEHAHCYSQGKAGYFLDREKCFDRLPWEITFELERATGFPPKWTEADRRLNAGLRTAFRLGPLVGPFWTSTNSFRQGLASSVRRVTLVMAVWVRRQLNTLPKAFVGNFFDDCLVVANTPAERQTSMNESDRFDELTGQKIGHKKTVGFTTLPGSQPLTSRGVLLRQVDVDKLLGVLIPTQGLRDPLLQDSRVEEATKHLLPIAKLPVPLEEKAELIALKTAGARYGLEIAEPTPAVAHAFDQQVLRVLCGPKNLRCKATAMCVAWKGHLIFMEFAIPFQAVAMARRQLCRSALAAGLFREVWEFRDAHDDWSGAGICAHLHRQCEQLGWEWEEPFFIRTKHALDVDLQCALPGWFQHHLRVAIRQAKLAQAPPRKDLEGIQDGINYELTTASLVGRTLTAAERVRLRFLWEGRVATEERAAKFRHGHGTCRFCTEGVVETSMHISKDCVAFADQRAQLLASTTEAERATWPPCFWNAGIAPYDPDIAVLAQELQGFDFQDGPPPQASSCSPASEWRRDGRLVVAGDGACSNQGTQIARAGCGGFFGPDHALNFAFPLEGPAQDSDRAELRALLRVARWTPKATEYLTDNEAVQVGFEKLLLHHPRPWTEHNDLWHALRQVLEHRGWDFLVVSFVKGHATEVDIGLGRASPKEAQWNDQADCLAVAGAAAHSVPDDLAERFRRQARVTKLMQRTLLDIHAARTDAWQRQQLASLEDQDGPGPALESEGGGDTTALEPPASKPRQLDEQSVFQHPKLVLPRYCWDRPSAGVCHELRPLPDRVGAAQSAKDRHKGCAHHLPWRYGYGTLEPLYWFWASMPWVDEAAAEGDVVKATSFVELAIAFQLVTGVLPAFERDGSNPNMQQRAHFFGAASKRLAAIIGGPIAPGELLPMPDVLRRLRFQHAPGVAGRIVLPADYWQHFCMVLLRAHVEVPAVTGAQRQLKTHISWF